MQISTVRRRGNYYNCQGHEELFKLPSCQRAQMEIRNHFRFIRLVSIRKLEYQVLRENQNPHGECDNSFSHPGEHLRCSVKSTVPVPHGPEVLQGH